MMRPRLLAATLGIFLVTILVRLAVAALVPIVQDEAYYLEWSKALDWGYFDHPPMVAWTGVTERLATSSALAGRIGTMLVAALSFPFIVGLVRRAGFTERRAYLAGLLLVNFNFCALISGMLTTPDAAFFTAWCAALHEAAAALAGDRRRWLTAGLVVGLGLLSKYIMVLIGPVFLWGLIRGDARALRSPWPWAGAVAALLVFAPHLVWNAHNEWVPVRMQLQHGFQGGHDPGFTLAADLPHPETPEPGSPEATLGKYFGGVIVTGTPPPGPVLLPLLRRMSEYLGGLLVVWGAFMAPLVHRFLLMFGGRAPPGPVLDPRVKPLLVGATLVPVLFFGFAAIFSAVELNWPAIYVVGGALLLTGFGASRLRPLVIFAGINVVICLALAMHAFYPVLARGRDRILKETHGWEDLAAHVAELDGPIMTVREQTTSMIRFYQPELTVVQWPGITQPSEFVRRREWNPIDEAMLRELGSFWIVLEYPLPPKLEGFEPVELIELCDCLEEGLVVTEAFATRRFEPPCPESAVHTWYLARYRVTAGG